MLPAVSGSVFPDRRHAQRLVSQTRLHRMLKDLPSGWDPEAADLVVYATQIPLYPGADAEDAMGSDLYGDDRASHMKGMAIWFTSEGTAEELEAWYDKRLAEATKEHSEDGYVTFTLLPEGGMPDETIGVIVEEDGKFRVFERVKADRTES